MNAKNILLGLCVIVLCGFGASNPDMALANENGSAASVTRLWHTYYGSNAAEYGAAIATDADNNIYVTGVGNASWQGDGGANPKHGYTGQSDVFVLKLNRDGVYQWHTFYGSTDEDGASGITVDAQGNVYVTGTSNQQWQGDNGAPPLHQAGNGFVLKLNRNGAYQWHTFYKMSASGVAVDTDGNVLVTGNSDASWNGSGGKKPLHAHSGATDMTILKLTNAGQYQWHTFYGPAAATSIATGKQNSVFVSGDTGSNWLGDGNKPPIHPFTGGTDWSVLALTSQGAYQWHTFYGGNGEDTTANLALDARNNIFVAGSSLASWLGDANQPPIVAHHGDADTALLKLNKKGAYQWHTFAGTNLAEQRQHLALDQNGSPSVTASTVDLWWGDMCVQPGGYCEDHTMGATRFSAAGNVEQNSSCTVEGTPGQYNLASSGVATDRNNNTLVLGDINTSACGSGTPKHAYSGDSDVVVLKEYLAEPPPPALLKPANHTTLKKIRPNLVWGAAANATSYHVQIRQDNRKGALIADTNVNALLFKTPTLARGKTYFWHVQACGDNGCSLWSVWWKFTVKSK